MSQSLLQPESFQQTSATRGVVPAAVLPPQPPCPHSALNCTSPGVPQALQGASWAAGVSHCWAHLPGQWSQISVLCLVSFWLCTCHSCVGGCLVVQTGALLIRSELLRSQGDDCKSKKGGSGVRTVCKSRLSRNWLFLWAVSPPLNGIRRYSTSSHILLTLLSPSHPLSCSQSSAVPAPLFSLTPLPRKQGHTPSPPSD